MVLFCLLAPVSAAEYVHFTFDNVDVNNGGTATMRLCMEHHSPANGTSGYDFDLTIADPAKAQFTGLSYNTSLRGITPTIPSFPRSVLRVSWADSDHVIEKGQTVDACVATITVKGLSAGSTPVNVVLNDVTGDPPEWADLSSGTTIISPRITVGGTTSVTPNPTTASLPAVVLIPGAGSKPADPDHDGRYEDVNGDGVLNYSDVTFYFQNWHWIENNEPVALFDFDRNGIIDFGDIILLNEMRT